MPPDELMNYMKMEGLNDMSFIWAAATLKVLMRHRPLRWYMILWFYIRKGVTLPKGRSSNIHWFIEIHGKRLRVTPRYLEAVPCFCFTFDVMNLKGNFLSFIPFVIFIFFSETFIYVLKIPLWCIFFIFRCSLFSDVINYFIRILI